MTDRPDEKGRANRRQGAAYQGAIEAVFAILIGAFLGKLADDHFGTAPRGLVIGFAIGFCSFVVRLLRLRRLLESAPPDGESEPDDR